MRIGLTAEEGARVVAVARTWTSTPFHPDAAVKNAGVDCGRLLLEVYVEAGLIDRASVPEIPRMPRGWHLNSGDERYRALVEGFAVKVDPPWEVGDVLLFRGRRWRSVGHGALYVGENRVIHAIEGATVREWPLTPLLLGSIEAGYRLRRDV